MPTCRVHFELKICPCWVLWNLRKSSLAYLAYCKAHAVLHQLSNCSTALPRRSEVVTIATSYWYVGFIGIENNGICRTRTRMKVEGINKWPERSNHSTEQLYREPLLPRHPQSVQIVGFSLHRRFTISSATVRHAGLFLRRVSTILHWRLWKNSGRSGKLK